MRYISQGYEKNFDRLYIKQTFLYKGNSKKYVFLELVKTINALIIIIKKYENFQRWSSGNSEIFLRSFLQKYIS